MTLLLAHLGGDGAVVILVEYCEGLLEGGQVVRGEALQDPLPVRVGEGSHSFSVTMAESQYPGSYLLSLASR